MRAAILALSLLALVACSYGPASGSGSPAGEGAGSASAAAGSASTAAGSASTGATAGADWPSYHRGNDRSGAASGVPAPDRLAQGWTAKLDGAVYGQPLVLGDLVIAATEQDTVYGLGLGDGAVRWRLHLGQPAARSQLPCGDIDPLGITGTPAYDPGSDTVFVAAETSGGGHQLDAVAARTGQLRWRRPLDLTSRDQAAEQQRGALAVANGRVYVPFGGLSGDCGNYVGYLTATSVDGTGATTRYEVPTRRQGGIWAPSGIAVDASGDVWAAVGNGASVDVPYDGSDSVLRLTPDLSRRLDFFAPTSWGSENAEDADLGATGPLLLDRGRVLISGKTGDVYLLAAGRLGGIGGELARIGGCRGFGGMAWDVAEQAAFVPCDNGLLRVDVGQRSLTADWRAAPRVNGSPVVGGGAVWSLDPGSGTLYALAEATGASITSSTVGPTNRFASPVLTGRRVLVPTLTGVSSLLIDR
jgi:outer membrane protein assembly factor BamB